MSNTVGNVPAVMLLLGLCSGAGEGALMALALLSTLGGNLLLVGSIANIIVAKRTAACGVRLGFVDFARAGVPMTHANYALASAWLGATTLLPW